MDPEVGCLDIKGEQTGVLDGKFGNDCVKACEDNLIKYFSNGNSGSNFVWEVVGDADIISSTSSTLTLKWQSVGFGVVRLIETSVNGCIAETEICVEIIP